MQSTSTSRRARLLEAQADALEAAAKATRELATMEAGERDPEWISQHDSPLGKRAHLAAVRAGKLRGRKVGKKVLVHRTDLDAFIVANGTERPKEPRSSSLDSLRDELGLERQPRPRKSEPRAIGKTAANSEPQLDEASGIGAAK